MLSSPELGLGSCCSPWLLLPWRTLLLQQDQHGHSMGWEDWQSNGIPAFTAPMPLLKLFTCTKPTQLSPLVILVTKPSGQKGWSNISAMGLGRGKEERGPPCQGMLCWGREMSLAQGRSPCTPQDPQLPMHQGHSNHCKGIPFPTALLPAHRLNLGIKLPQTPNAKALPKPH